MGAAGPEPGARFLDRLARWMLAGLALAALDLAWVGATTAGFAAASLLLCAALLLALPLSLAERPLRALAARRPGLVLGVGAAALLALCLPFAGTAFSGAGISRLLGGWRAPAAVAAGILLALGALGMALLLRRLFSGRSMMKPGERFAVGLLLLVAAVGLDLLNRALYVGLYAGIHRALALLTMALVIVAAAWSWRPGRWLTGAVLAACLAGVAAAAVALPELDRSRSAVNRIMRRGALSRQVLRAVWHLTDRDGDGCSPVLGGGDCDDTRSDVHAGAIDIPGNGVDENCLDGDAVPAPAAPGPACPEPGPEPGPEPAMGIWTGGSPAGAVRGRQRPDLLLISVDALRPDFVHGLGHPRGNTPNIDVLIDRGVSFTRAHTTSPATGSTLPTLVTGRYFSNLYPEFKKDGNPPAEVAPVPSLLTELAQAGYHVVAAIEPSYRRFLRDRGVIWASHDLRELLPLAGERPEKPLALWLHQMDTHMTYEADLLAEFRRALFDEHIPGVKRRYERAVAQADADVGRLLDWQEGRGRLERTVVVLTADHGEEFGEHRGIGHGRTLYQEVLRVPLIFLAPGIASRKVDVPVSVADIAPTVRQLLGLPRQPGADGRRLGTCLRGGACPVRPIYAEVLYSARRFAVIHEGYKLIQSWPRVQQLFDLARDPGEQDNLVDREPARRDALEKLLNRCRQGACRTGP